MSGGTAKSPDGLPGYLGPTTLVDGAVCPVADADGVVHADLSDLAPGVLGQENVCKTNPCTGAKFSADWSCTEVDPATLADHTWVFVRTVGCGLVTFATPAVKDDQGDTLVYKYFFSQATDELVGVISRLPPSSTCPEIKEVNVGNTTECPGARTSVCTPATGSDAADGGADGG